MNNSNTIIKKVDSKISSKFKLFLFILYFAIALSNFQFYKFHDGIIYTASFNTKNENVLELLDDIVSVQYLKYTKSTNKGADSYEIYYYTNGKIIWAGTCNTSEFNTIKVSSVILGAKIEEYEPVRGTTLFIFFILICFFPTKNKVYYEVQ